MNAVQIELISYSELLLRMNNYFNNALFSSFVLNSLVIDLLLLKFAFEDLALLQYDPFSFVVHKSTEERFRIEMERIEEQLCLQQLVKRRIESLFQQVRNVTSYM
jgi:hypothetical protein